MTARRDVAQSLFPDLLPDRPIGRLPPSVVTGSNADLMAAIADIYLTGTVLDTTYGDGRWWRRTRPAVLVAHDLHKGDGVDFRALPHRARSFDTVCFDPPYVTEGGTATEAVCARFRARYGIERVTSWGAEADLFALILDGLAECARVARRYLLVKCMEFTASRQFHDVPHIVKTRALELGLVQWDVIVHHTGSGPGGHNIFTPVRARRHHSYLLVFTHADQPPPIPTTQETPT